VTGVTSLVQPLELFVPESREPRKKLLQEFFITDKSFTPLSFFLWRNVENPFEIAADDHQGVDPSCASYRLSVCVRSSCRLGKYIEFPQILCIALLNDHVVHIFDRSNSILSTVPELEP